jgi:hypothetical protein
VYSAGSVVAIGILTLFLLPGVAQAAVNDPTAYTVSSYEYYAGLKIVNSIPNINHQDVVTINYNKESNMDILTPPEVSTARARLFYIFSDGTRQAEHLFKDVSSVTSAYTWTKNGQYEVDIFGVVGTSTDEIYLTTMEFTVNISGGPAPICNLTATPSTIYPKQGGSALLEWSSTDAVSATFDQEIGVVATSGSLIVSPNATTTYTATFTGLNGEATCDVTVGVPDPVIVPLHEKAAALARQLVDQPDAYLWGGKGWDYDLAEFTTPVRILSGYTYFNPDTSSKQTGVGVDCSGLITWAFNRSNNPTSGFSSNYVKYVNADGMFRDYQSDPVAESDIRPGDTLTFDWDSNGRMDHVAMYVGDSGGYDVVNAGSPAVGIIGRLNSNYKLIPGFEGFRRIHQADVAMTITTGSPVDIQVTDPAGNLLTVSSTIFSEEEYIREVPGELYYLELEQGHDGRPQDLVIVPEVKDGSYTIEVTPEPLADSTATYSLTAAVNGTETVLVSDQPISTIPEKGFTVQLNGGEVTNADPTVKVLLEGLYDTINALTLSSPQRKQNLLATASAALDWFDRNRTDQVIRKLTKLQNDVARHIADELTVEEFNQINAQIDELLLLLQ